MLRHEASGQLTTWLVGAQVVYSFTVPALLFTSMMRAAPHLQPTMLLLLPLAAAQVSAAPVLPPPCAAPVRCCPLPATP